MLTTLRSLFGRENRDSGESPGRQKEAGLPSEFKSPRKKWSWGKHRASGEPSCPTKLLSKRQMRKEMKKLTNQLQVITQEGNDLRDSLILITEGSLDERPYNRPNPLLEKLRKEHKQVMLDLQNLERENAEASKNLTELDMEIAFYWLLMEQNQLKKRVDMLRQEKKKVQGDWALLQQICKDQEEEISDL